LIGGSYPWNTTVTIEGFNWENRRVAETAAIQRESGPASPVATSPAIALAHLWRDYGERTALRDVTLELPGGQTLAVLGPNGAGKTTLLRVLATLLRPTAGEVSVLGCALPREAWKARGRIGYLGHEPLCYRDLTCAENLRFQAHLHGLGSEAPERIAELLDLVRMSRWGGELVRNLSAGMVQRLAVCRAVLHDPELLLLDEPRSHLDPEAAALVEPLIGPAPGRTRVVVTHDIEAGLAEGDHVLALRGGGAVAYHGAASGLSAGDARAIYGGAP
jgi:heme exporter protein A